MNKKEFKEDLQSLGARLRRATGFSLKGLQAAFRNEQAFRLETYALLIIVIPGALGLGDSGVEKVLLIGSWLLVMITELLNSAVEAVVDRIGSEPHELSGRAKDVASAAVMIALILAALTWLTLIF